MDGTIRLADSPLFTCKNSVCMPGVVPVNSREWPKIISVKKSYTLRCSNIIYHGMVEYTEYLQILHDVSFLLSTRDPNAPENQCNFPSKIIEALLHNRIVVTTLHYPQLDGINYLEVPAQIDGFVSALQDIVEMPQDMLFLYANQSEKVMHRFNTEAWKSNIKKIETMKKA